MRDELIFERHLMRHYPKTRLFVDVGRCPFVVILTHTVPTI